MFNKEKVHIDELVQSRLAGESDGMGVHQAWDKMRVLLDDKEEKRPAAGFWRVNWLLPLILITVLSGAGLWYYHQGQADEMSLANGDMQTENVDNKQVELLADINSHKSIASSQNSATNGEVSPTHVAQKEESNTNNNSLKKSTSNKKKYIKNTVPAALAVHKNSSNKEAGSKKIAINDRGQAVTLSSNQNIEAGKQLAVIANKFPIQSQAENDIQQALISDAADGKLFIDPSQGHVVTRKETANHRVYTVTERQEVKDGKNVFIKDTVENGYRTVVKYMPLMDIEIKALQQGLEIYALDKFSGDMQPIAIYTNTSDQGSEDVLASSEAKSGKGVLTKSGSTDALLSDLNNFFEIRKRFYTNIFGGFSSSVSNPFPMGFQAGFGLHYWIGNHWTVGTELGYAFRPMNHTFIDESSIFTQIGDGVSVPGGKRYNYNEYKTSQHYNISYIQAFEVPLLFTYQKGNWSCYGGPALSFGMPIRFQKMESVSSEDKVVIQNEEALNMPSTSLRSTPDDFNARLGLGAMLGVNYNLNRNFGLSFRYSHVMIDNATTHVGQELSSKMFRSPSFRFGINYKIGRDKNVQYMMGNK